MGEKIDTSIFYINIEQNMYLKMINEKTAAE